MDYFEELDRVDFPPASSNLARLRGVSGDSAWYDLFSKLERACVDLDNAWSAHKSIEQSSIDANAFNQWSAINTDFASKANELTGWIDKINAVLEYVPGTNLVSKNGLAVLPVAIAGLSVGAAVLIIGGVLAAVFALQSTAAQFYTFVTGKTPPSNPDSVASMVKWGIIGYLAVQLLPVLLKGKS